MLRVFLTFTKILAAPRMPSAHNERACCGVITGGISVAGAWIQQWILSLRHCLYSARQEGWARACFVVDGMATTPVCDQPVASESYHEDIHERCNTR